jgi:hypothetical protein
MPIYLKIIASIGRNQSRSNKPHDFSLSLFSFQQKGDPFVSYKNHCTYGTIIHRNNQ